MTTDPIVIPLDERAAKLLLEQRDQYIRQSAETRDGKVPDFRDVKTTNNPCSVPVARHRDRRAP